MEHDLLFTITVNENWKEITTEGYFTPKSVEELGYIKCIDESSIEAYINTDDFLDQDLLLVVIDPLRIKDTIKNEKEGDFKVIKIKGRLTMDAIIDKIPLERNSHGKYVLNIKHYD